MKKINFTKEHLDRLQVLSFKMLKNNSVIRKGNGVGTSLNVNDLFHVETENSLRSVNTYLLKQIEEKSKVDRWTSTDDDQRTLNKLKEQQELIDLLIGYKISKRQTQEAKAERSRIRQELTELENSTKKPEDRIKELQAKLAEDTSAEFDDE